MEELNARVLVETIEAKATRFRRLTRCVFFFLPRIISGCHAADQSQVLGTRNKLKIHRQRHRVHPAASAIIIRPISEHGAPVWCTTTPGPRPPPRPGRARGGLYMHPPGQLRSCVEKRVTPGITPASGSKTRDRSRALAVKAPPGSGWKVQAGPEHKHRAVPQTLASRQAYRRSRVLPVTPSRNSRQASRRVEPSYQRAHTLQNFGCGPLTTATRRTGGPWPPSPWGATGGRR